MLAEEPELAEFHALLVMMDQALTSVPGIDDWRLLLGRGENNEGRDDPWVGYNLDHLAYYFYVYVRDPEVLIFQKCEGGIDPTTWDGETGRISESCGKPRWSDQIDLASPEIDFFSASKSRQVEILEEFLTRSLEFSQTLGPSPD